MATIGSRSNFSDGTHNFIQLANEEIVRVLAHQNGWQRARVGILFAVQGNATFSMVTNGIGLCTGAIPVTNSQGYKSNSTVHWSGHSGAGDGFGNQTWTFNAGPPAYWSLAFSLFVRKTGSTVTNLSGFSATLFAAVAGQGNRSFMFVDFEKDTNGICIFMPTSAAQAQTDYNMSDLIIGCEQVQRNQALTLRGTVITPPDSVVYNFDAIGPADSFSYFWGNTAPNAVEVYGYCVQTTCLF